MKRSAKAGGVVLLIVASTTLFWFIGPLGCLSADLRWGVKAGMEFSYRIEYRYQNQTDYNVHHHVALRLLPLNNTEVVFKVARLPWIPIALSADEFASLIEQTKCSVRFANGSAVAEDYSEVLISLFSSCLLPVGDWTYLDELFVDRIHLMEQNYIYVSRIEGKSFIIGNIRKTYHEKAGWSGFVNMSTGVPISIRQHLHRLMDDGSSYQYSLYLQQDTPLYLQWGVQMGMEFSYRVEYRYRTYCDYPLNDEIEDAIALWLLPLNNTEVIFRVTHLPSIPVMVSPEGLLASILNQTKCSVRFANGSAVAEDHSAVLVSLFSKCLLPRGNWALLDRLFDDIFISYSMYKLDYAYISRIEKDSFFFGHIGDSQHGQGGWSGLVNMTTGVPSSIRQFEGWAFPFYRYHYDLFLYIQE